MRAAIYLLTAGTVCQALVALLQWFGWRGMPEGDIGFKEFPMLPQFLMPVATPIILELFLVRERPIFGVILVLRLLAFILLLSGGIIGLKAGLLREIFSLLTSRDITSQRSPGRFLARLGLLIACALVVLWAGRATYLGVREARTRSLGEALSKAVSEGDMAGAKRLLDQGADPNFPEDMADSLLYGVQSDNTAMVELLIDRGAHLKAVEENVIEAAPSDQMMKLLIDRGANVDAIPPYDPNGITPLMRAAGGGNLEQVQRLLRHGADPTRKTAQGETALSFVQRMRTTMPPPESDGKNRPPDPFLPIEEELKKALAARQQ